MGQNKKTVHDPAMGRSGLRYRRELWVVLFCAGYVDPHMWEIALRRVRDGGCGVCERGAEQVKREAGS